LKTHAECYFNLILASLVRELIENEKMWDNPQFLEKFDEFHLCACACAHKHSEGAGPT